MTAYIVKRDDDAVGYLTDSNLAEFLDGQDVVVDGLHEHQEYTIEEVPNDDVF